ncbi:unnamed protein product [Caenorhabditis auriculariae]|uniref:SXP/RAL-2 family protein Ani s 5-like cation-binding domain-containing protein n=1 Tax=Caenorhabditis auriculariae TaxID=2777116 RepID=A0A8S1HML8_9PELO|nr:unnamed protein product [Caenorhabditis auriculariae]
MSTAFKIFTLLALCAVASAEFQNMSALYDIFAPRDGGEKPFYEKNLEDLLKSFLQQIKDMGVEKPTVKVVDEGIKKLIAGLKANPKLTPAQFKQKFGIKWNKEFVDKLLQQPVGDVSKVAEVVLKIKKRKQ